MYKKSTKQWFSIIEILVGMFIFSLWIISIYAVISSSLRINEYNKNYIIAANLAREQVELLRNNRDYNYYKIQKFDQMNPANLTFSNVLWDITQIKNYKVSNNFLASASFLINIEEISVWDFSDDSNYQLCFDDTENVYIYCPPSTTLKKLPFFKYVSIEKNTDWDELLINSVVKWKIKGEHEFELKTILADWKQL